MTYGQCKARALGLIFSQQIAGEIIPETYNNQADYIAKIPGLINDAQIYLATGPKPILDVAMLSDLVYEEKDGSRLYTMPHDCYKMMMGGLIRPGNGRGKYAADRLDDYTIVGDTKFIVPNRVDETMLMEYYRYPRMLSDTPAETTQLDNSADVHECIPFYVAAYLVMYDSPFMYSALYNNFETRLQRLSKPTFVVHSDIRDVYNGFGGGY